MTAPIRNLSAVPFGPQDHGATGARAASSGESFRKPISVAGAAPDPLAGRLADLHALRRAMPERFAQLLEAQFRSNDEAALFFGVTERTIRNWKAGRNEPAASAVLFLIHTRPSAARQLLGE